MTRKQFSDATGIDSVKVLRNETGMEQRSVKGSSELREALIALGREVPAVPVGEDTPEPVEGSVVVEIAPVDAQHPKARTIRQNIRRLREEAGFYVEDLADAVSISAERLLAYERGELMVPFTDLEEIATRLGHEVGHFSQDKPPPTTLGQLDDFWRRRRLHERMTPEQKAKKRELDEEYARKLEAALSPGFAEQKRALQDHMKKAKDRKGKR